MEEEPDRGERQQDRQADAEEARLHEGDRSQPAPNRTSGSMSSVFSRRRRTTSPMMTRTTATAVNIEIAMPSIMVTAKPRTGPEPTMNSSAVAISVVTLASTIVE
jgi:hypothetical protein